MKVATSFHKTWVKTQDQNKCEQVCGSLMCLYRSYIFKQILLHFVSKEEFLWQRPKPFSSQCPRQRVQKEMDGETETVEKEAKSWDFTVDLNLFYVTVHVTTWFIKISWVSASDQLRAGCSSGGGWRFDPDQYGLLLLLWCWLLQRWPGNF